MIHEKLTLDLQLLFGLFKLWFHFHFGESHFQRVFESKENANSYLISGVKGDSHRIWEHCKLCNIQVVEQLFYFSIIWQFLSQIIC